MTITLNSLPLEKDPFRMDLSQSVYFKSITTSTESPLKVPTQTSAPPPRLTLVLIT